MLITEGFAKTLWCPETRMALVERIAANTTAAMDPSGEGYANIFKETRCQGVGCMMWRWSNEREGSQRLGYCGKAGPAMR